LRGKVLRFPASLVVKSGSTMCSNVAAPIPRDRFLVGDRDLAAGLAKGAVYLAASPPLRSAR
jgi:uncharacterized protein (DUF779 family)